MTGIMSRSERLLDLIQILRRHRRPVSGLVLAGELDVSIRTLYRDIATLRVAARKSCLPWTLPNWSTRPMPTGPGVGST